jgi:endoglucanase
MTGPVAGLAAAALTLGVTLLAPSASAGSLTGTLYVDPTTQSARWVAANPNDSRASVIRDRVATKAQARWMSAYNTSTVTSVVSEYITAANSAGQVPAIVVYEIPNRDCGGASAGGAPDLNAYANWVSLFAQGLGSEPVIVLLEPDSLALLTCLNASEITARSNAIANAVTTIKTANPNAKVYLDGGHSRWNSATVAADRLKAAGVMQADGFYTNVSNYQFTDAEITFGKAVLAALGNPANLHQIIDVSRNGNGPDARGEWCDPAGRKVGQDPTLDTGVDTVDGLIWAKLPGEADGCAGSAGSFVPDLAYRLAMGS